MVQKPKDMKSVGREIGTVVGSDGAEGMMIERVMIEKVDCKSVLLLIKHFFSFLFSFFFFFLLFSFFFLFSSFFFLLSFFLLSFFLLFFFLLFFSLYFSYKGYNRPKERVMLHSNSRKSKEGETNLVTTTMVGFEETPWETSQQFMRPDPNPSLSEDPYRLGASVPLDAWIATQKYAGISGKVRGDIKVRFT